MSGASGPFWDGVRGLMENLTDMMVLADKKGNIIHTNAALEILTGHIATELIGQNVSVLMPEEFAGNHQSHVDSFVSKTDTNRSQGMRRKNSFTVCKIVKPIKGQLKKKDGSVISVEIVINHLSEQSGTQDYYLMAHIKDLTKQEMAERQQQDFLAGVAHELRTPLNGIIGLSDALIKTEQNKGRTKHLKMINSCGVRLVGLVNMIMDVSALRDGKMQLNLTKTVNCNEICEEVWELMNMAVDKNGKKIKKESVELQIECDSDLPTIEGDKERLSQVVFNLVNNALKFTPSGFVRIGSKFEAEAGTILLCVSDSGQGIKKENLKKIFEAFGQEEEGKGGGLGLGLAICTKVTELHGGKIWVESELGKGSQFYVRLPQRIADEVKEAGGAQDAGNKHASFGSAFQTAQMENSRMSKRHSTASKALLTAAAEGDDEGKTDVASEGDADDDEGEVTIQEEALRRLAESGTIRVLYCDDEVKNHEALESILDKEAGFEYKRSLDGYDCIENLESHALPDMLMISASMTTQSVGGMTGYEVLDIIRREFHPSLPVIMITHELTPAGRLEAVKRLANDIIQRPAEKEELATKIHALVVRKLMEDINFEKKVTNEMMQRTLPQNVLASIRQNEGSLVANKFESVTFLYGMMKEFDIIQQIVPISQLCVLLNKMTTAFDLFLKAHDIFKVDMDGAGVLVVCGHDRQEDHVEKILSYAKDVLSGLAQSNINVVGKSVEFLIGVATGLSYGGLIVGGGRTMPCYSFFGETVDLAKHMAITGVGNHVHCTETTKVEIDKEYEGSGLYEFEERGTLGANESGQGGVKTFLMKESVEEDLSQFKSSMLDITLMNGLAGSHGGGGSGADAVAEFEYQVKELEYRIKIMKGTSDETSMLETELKTKGKVYPTALLSIAEPIECILDSLAAAIGGPKEGSANLVPPVCEQLQSLASEMTSACSVVDVANSSLRICNRIAQRANVMTDSATGQRMGLTAEQGESMAAILEDVIQAVGIASGEIPEGEGGPPNFVELADEMASIQQVVDQLASQYTTLMMFVQQQKMTLGAGAAAPGASADAFSTVSRMSMLASNPMGVGGMDVMMQQQQLMAKDAEIRAANQTITELNTQMARFQSGDIDIGGLTREIAKLKSDIVQKDMMLQQCGGGMFGGGMGMAGSPVGGGGASQEVYQELLLTQQDCRHLQLELEWYHSKLQELVVSTNHLAQDNTQLQRELREAQLLLSEQERQLRHQEIRIQGMGGANASPANLMASGPWTRSLAAPPGAESGLHPSIVGGGSKMSTLPMP
ncbi:hypothetical protein FOL47_003452 [Perkinsus chesapeaki]|uniref:histidine kinase n=1 Tax=Perkinsus chesapeaki TaxID=330153 RepID=A0A7J6M7R5_PERCH|nr:hypothetical protein FOL47_003452 [Perkinsus chesapeaki]